jgi:hypothetical protein
MSSVKMLSANIPRRISQASRITIRKSKDSQSKIRIHSWSNRQSTSRWSSCYRHYSLAKRQLDIMVLKLGPTWPVQREGRRTKETCWSSDWLFGGVDWVVYVLVM